MIISHTHKFVFLPTRDTDCARVEVAVSGFCGPKDVLTPLGHDDELLRRDLGVVPRNYAWWPFSMLTGGLLNVHGVNRKPNQLLYHRGFRRHGRFPSVAQIRKSLPRATRDEYFIFAVERDPMDRLVSRYYQALQNGTVTNVDEFFARGLPPANSQVYAPNGLLEVDALLRFHDLHRDYGRVVHRLGLSDMVWLPNSTRQLRAKQKHWRDLFSPAQIDQAVRHYCDDFHHLSRLGAVFAPEIQDRLPHLSVYALPSPGRVLSLEGVAA